MPWFTHDARLALVLVLPLAIASGCTMNNPLFEVTAAGADSSGEGSGSTSATSVEVTTTGPDATSTPTSTQGTSITSTTTIDPGTGTTLEPGTTTGPMGVCGDGHIDPGELCDSGVLGDDQCTPECTLLSCGDGVITAPEQCDDQNDVDEDGCLSTCVYASCGDGYLFAGTESCDDGKNGDQDDGCTDLCLFPKCSDGFVQPSLGEECDDGNLDAGDGCSASCLPETKCGNGQVEVGEVCDDGNADDNDNCTSKCQPPKCGDGLLLVGIEQCDDGNGEDNDACKNNCTKNPCGDGIFDANTEECDWAEQNFKNAPGVCSNTCKVNSCFKVTNDDKTNIQDINWFDPCIDADGTKVHILVFDANKQLTYIGSGMKNGDWKYEEITSMAAAGDQWKLVINHQPIILSPKSDRLYITARSSIPNLLTCPSSLGDGYGVTILPMFGDAPKLVFMPTVGKSGKLRNFKNWTASNELSYGVMGMNMCGELGPTPLLGSTVYIAVTD